MTDAPELLVADGDEWREWLAANYAASTGVRLVLAKKGATEPTRLTYDDALPEALCFGWIDGQLTRRDDTTYRVRFTPRRARSAWSARNVAAAEHLISQGRMQPPGRGGAGRPRSGGRGERAYDGQGSIAVRNARREALAASPRAQAMWEVLTRTNRYAVLYRIQEAKREQTRARRISQYVEMLARGDTPYPQKAKPAG